VTGKELDTRKQLAAIEQVRRLVEVNGQARVEDFVADLLLKATVVLQASRCLLH
jgi:hypothetical protein